MNEWIKLRIRFGGRRVQGLTAYRKSTCSWANHNKYVFHSVILRAVKSTINNERKLHVCKCQSRIQHGVSRLSGEVIQSILTDVIPYDAVTVKIRAIQLHRTRKFTEYCPRSNWCRNTRLQLKVFDYVGVVQEVFETIGKVADWQDKAEQVRSARNRPQMNLNVIDS